MTSLAYLRPLRRPLARMTRVGLVVLCGLLTLAAPILAQLPPSVWAMPLVPVPLPEEEEEQRAQLETEDAEVAPGARGMTAQPSTNRHRATTPPVIAWLAHLALPHGSACGPNLFVRTPSLQATNLPLLC